MDLGSKRPRPARVEVAIACALFLIASCASGSSEQGDRIALRAVDAAPLDEIRDSLGATRIRTISTGGQIWEVPPGTRDDALLRYGGDPRLAYMEPLEGSEYQLFAERPFAGELTPQQLHIVTKLSHRATSGEVRTTTLQAHRFTTDLLRTASVDEPPFELNLLPGEAFQARTVGVEVRPGGFTWHGDPGDGGQATLVVNGGNVTGQVYAGGGSYAIEPLGDGLHAVYRVDVDAFPPDHGP